MGRTPENEPVSAFLGFPACQPTIGVATAIDDFGFDLQRRTSESGGPNTVVAPYSVAALLTMAGNSANGETAAQMRRVLHSDAISYQEVKLQLGRGRLNAVIASRSAEQTLSFANAMWARNGLGLLLSFIADNWDTYRAEVNSLDFHSSDMASVVKRWVADKTLGLIPEIVQQVNPRSLFLLSNVAFFQGLLEIPFRLNGALEEAFTLPDGSKVRVPMMSRADVSIQCFETRSFVIVRLPYRGSESAMYLVLPNEEIGLAGLLYTLTGQEFIGTARLAPRTSPKEVLILKLPRLNLAWGSEELDHGLSAMGMPVAFDRSKAGFAGIAPRRPLFISQFVHKTRIKVGELGTEAAAANLLGLVIGFPPSIVFDHPFLFVFVDEKRGAALFLGVVKDPTAN